MQKPVLFVLVVFHCLFAAGQKLNYFSVVAGLGVSGLLNESGPRRQPGLTGALGINYCFKNRQQTFAFSPGLQHQVNEYHARFTGQWGAQVSQHIAMLTADVLLRLSRRCLLRTGLLFGRMYYSEASLYFTQGNSRTYYSNTEISRNYKPTLWQAGFTLGLSFPFKLVRREQKFNLKLAHLVSSLVNSDYTVSNAITGTELAVLTTKSRPFLLTAGFEISLQRLKKKKTEQEEE